MLRYLVLSNSWFSFSSDSRADIKSVTAFSLDCSVLNQGQGVNGNWGGELDWMGEMRIFGEA